MALADSEDTQQEGWQVRDFVRDAVECLEKAFQDDPDAATWMAELQQQAEESWGDCLELITPGDAPVTNHLAWQPASEQLDVDVESNVNSSQIGLILESLDTDGSDESGDDRGHTRRLAEAGNLVSDSETSNGDAEDTILIDPEIRDAFLDDAQRCLASIESSLLAYEANPGMAQPIKQVCRELHTLKGASASVGLAKLANFLHQVEDDLQTACDQEGAVDLQPIFKAVDAVRPGWRHPPRHRKHVSSI